MFAAPSAAPGVILQISPYVVGYVICRFFYKEYVEKKEAREEAEGIEKIRKRNEEFDLYYETEKERRKQAGCSLESDEDEDMVIYSSWDKR
jgi:hypothetical protein